MIINNLEIKNFGIYYGTNNFSFDIDNEDKNIILFGGENGSGKTTILQAIKIALYGSLVFGHKTNSKSYNDYIKDKFNVYALKDNQESASIALNFTIKQTGIVNSYEIKRQWFWSENTLKENFFVHTNNKLLNKKQTSDFESFIRKYIPPSLFEFFFFDGEEIRSLIEKGDFEDKLQNYAMTLFNLEIFDILKQDLDKYLEKENVFESLSKEEKNLKLLISNINTINDKIKFKEDKLSKLKTEKKNKNKQIKDIEKEFKLHGGLEKTEINKYEAEIEELEFEKKQKAEWIKSFAENVLPFVMTQNLLNKVNDQFMLEKNIERYYELEQQLNDDLHLKIKKEIQCQKILDPSSNVKINRLIKIFFDQFTQKIKPKNDLDSFKPIHSFSRDDYTEISSMQYKVNNFNSQKVINDFKTINNHNSRIKKLKDKIQIALKNQSLEHLWKERLALENRIKDLIEQIETINEDLDQLYEQSKELEIEANKLDEKILEIKKDKNAFYISKKIDKVLQKFIDCQIRIKIKEVESLFIERFTDLIRKDNFVDAVNIDTTTFKIDLYSEGELIPKTNLSAGEKQIYVISMLWAFTKASNRQIPLVFDTLLGRLDHSHKTSIVKKFLPISSEQTIILSTDTEIDNDYYKLLKPYISKEYLLDYNEETHKVDISNNYFPLKGD